MAQCSRMAISDTLPDRGEQYKRGALFRGIAPQDCEKVLGCLGAQERTYSKGEYIVHRGDNVRCIGFVMDGRIITERTDALGNRSILGSAGAGDVFAEAFAATGMTVDVDVVAAVSPPKKPATATSRASSPSPTRASSSPTTCAWTAAPSPASSTA